jgi:hypothetical protein
LSSRIAIGKQIVYETFEPPPKFNSARDIAVRARIEMSIISEIGPIEIPAACRLAH